MALHGWVRMERQRINCIIQIVLYTGKMFDPDPIPLYWVNRLSFLARRELADRFRAAGHRISPEEWAVLVMLWQQDGQGPGDISARSLRDATTVTRLVDGMVRKGLVERREGRRDRRRSEIWLTDQGRQLADVLPPIAGPLIAQAMQGLSQEETELALKVLQRMVENLSTDWTKEG